MSLAAKKSPHFLSWRYEVRENDVEAIGELVRKTEAFNEEEIAVAAELAREAYKKGEASDYQFVLAEIEGKLAAYTCYGRIPFTDERYDLYWIASNPAYQRAGIAEQVLQKTEEALLARGAKRLYAETSSREVYLPARQFYLKHGFVQVAELEDFYRSGDNKLTYMKVLEEE